MTSTDICNLALAHLGQARIGALTETTVSARACALHYEPTRDEVLRGHRWNFAQARVALVLDWQELIGGALSDAGGTIAVSATAHGLSTGQRVLVAEVEGLAGANGLWPVTVVDADAFTLDGTAYASGYSSGTGKWVRAPDFGWTYRYALPVDCLRVLEVNDSEAGDRLQPWIIEGRWLLTDAPGVNLVYVRRETEVALFDPLFVQALALKLAVVLSETIRGTTSKTAELLQAYERITGPLARRVDANETRRRKGLLPMNSLAIKARSSRIPWRL